jgi:branched-subunit amino acid aminotransferase/4-amino-4-deoxychorismate lyase
MRTVYLNGEYLPENEAKVSIFDRGFLMADGVYEVTSVLDGKLVDFDGHAIRLDRSLTELGMKNPISKDDLLAVHRELVAKNEIVDGGVYLQITRGAPADRDFVFPDPETTPCTVVLFTQSKPGITEGPASKSGIKVISIADERWGRRDIKTVQLLHIQQRLHRQRQQNHHARIVQRHPARDHACGCFAVRSRGADGSRRTPVHHRRSPRRGRGIHHVCDHVRERCCRNRRRANR